MVEPSGETWGSVAHSRSKTSIGSNEETPSFALIEIAIIRIKRIVRMDFSVK
jgi:hypothetical protein